LIFSKESFLNVYFCNFYLKINKVIFFLFLQTILIGEAHIMNGKTTSWVVTGVGAAVTAAGLMTGGMLGAGITGFGLAHVVLGVLDMFRPTVQR